MAADLYRIWFSSVTNVSLKAKETLLSYYETPENAFRSAPGSFYQVPGLSRSAAQIFEKRDMGRVSEIIAACSEQNIRILTFDEPGYPERLRNIYAAPQAIYVKGRLPDIDEIPLIAVIGTRKASENGIQMGKKLAFEISKCGGTVMSGLTQGIDAAAAEGALEAGGSCVAVLGTAHEKEHGKLAREVLRSGGALISEYAPGTEQDRGFFRARNRIAAGVSIAVVVVEAPEKSGTRLFVNDAVDQGKDVFAVPGSATDPNCAGTIALLKDGASPVTEGWDVMSTYESQFPGIIHHAPERYDMQASSKRRSLPKAKRQSADIPDADSGNSEKTVFADVLKGLNEDQQKILTVLLNGPLVTDDIIAGTSLPAPRVLSQLTILEIRGLIRREAGKRITLNFQAK